MIPIPNLSVTLIAAAIAFGGGWVANGWRLNGKIDRMVAEQSQALAAAGQNAMNEAARLQKQKDEALNEANKIAQRNAQAAADARSQLDRLRRQLANTPSLSSATCASTRDYATTLSLVFGECATRLGEMAKDADGHAADSRTLEGAWPR